jgi:hypothetical protein
MKGRRLSLPLGRRIVADLSHLSIGSPRAVVLGRIDVGNARDARMHATPRIAWPALFMKAYGLAAREVPELRRIYVKLPWPHVYQLPSSVGAVVVEREIEGETGLLLARFRHPADTPLAVLHAGIQAAKTGELSAQRAFVQALRLARLPLPLRRVLLWVGFNLGRQVPNFFGSFAISVLGGQGATILDTIAVWPSFLSYGPIAPDGTVDVVLSVDHRVIDGGPAARAIRIIGETLNGVVLDELCGLVPSLGDSNNTTTDVREFSKQSRAQR